MQPLQPNNVSSEDMTNLVSGGPSWCQQARSQDRLVARLRSVRNAEARRRAVISPPSSTFKSSATGAQEQGWRARAGLAAREDTAQERARRGARGTRASPRARCKSRAGSARGHGTGARATRSAPLCCALRAQEQGWQRERARHRSARDVERAGHELRRAEQGGRDKPRCRRG
jgi:hypothetical protein